jgi:hypothetical protein
MLLFFRIFQPRLIGDYARKVLEHEHAAKQAEEEDEFEEDEDDQQALTNRSTRKRRDNTGITLMSRQELEQYARSQAELYKAKRRL